MVFPLRRGLGTASKCGCTCSGFPLNGSCSRGVRATSPKASAGLPCIRVAIPSAVARAVVATAGLGPRGLEPGKPSLIPSDLWGLSGLATATDSKKSGWGSKGRAPLPIGDKTGSKIAPSLLRPYQSRQAFAACGKLRASLKMRGCVDTNPPHAHRHGAFGCAHL